MGKIVAGGSRQVSTYESSVLTERIHLLDVYLLWVLYVLGVLYASLLLLTIT